jgi:hypothetical protein
VDREGGLAATLDQTVPVPARAIPSKLSVGWVLAIEGRFFPLAAMMPDFEGNGSERCRRYPNCDEEYHLFAANLATLRKSSFMRVCHPGPVRR